MEKHIATLAEVGEPTLKLGNVVVLPFGGRVIGLYPQEDLNAVWVNPALATPETARALLHGPGWTNLGGDRTWLSPEFDLFVSDASSPATSYTVPKELDPGRYRVVARDAKAVELETTSRLLFFRKGHTVDFTLRKRIAPLDAPDFPLPAGVSAAGYELTCTLSVVGHLPETLHPAAWNLLQVPGGGEIVAPTRTSDAPVPYFGRQQVRREGDRLIASVPAPESYKFGVRADVCRGVMLYRRLDAPQPLVVFRRFSVGASSAYFDAPFDAQQRTGVAQQFYIDNGELGGFGELEYHTPALVSGQARPLTDTCTTWAFAGPADRLCQLAETLLAG